MRNLLRGLGIGLLTVGALAVACSSSTSGDDADARGNKGVGDSCASDNECRAGLSCSSGGACQLSGSVALNNPCTVSGECQDGLQCVSQLCVGGGEGDVGAACSSDIDCLQGLRCALVGFSAQCAPEGSGDVGKGCRTSSDCLSGLTCNQGLCGTPLPGSPTFGIPSFPGVNCAPPVESGVRAYFEVPGAEGGEFGDYFRLPFPNDVLLKNGRPDLEGFPTPGNDLLGFDPVKIYVDAIEAGASGWGTYPGVLFRFSGSVDLATLDFVEGEESPVRWVDITPGDTLGRNGGLAWFASEAGGNYVCPDWVGVVRPQGRPLTPGHTYAVFLTTNARAKDGSEIERSPHLAALLSDSAPSDPVLAEAHDSYALFRSYLAGEGIDASTILNATVITAEDVRKPMRDLAAAVQAADAPTASGWVKCGDGVTSPCPQADAEAGRGCGEASEAYDEYHALVTLPIFQEGTAPYLEEGGAISGGQVRTEDVCMALTVPTGAMPAEGWPLVVYGHGTGGGYTSHVRDEVAGALANVSTPSGDVQFAVLGIDQVQHGPRRGESTDSPNNLFFNFANPDAARGNPLQGAADVVSLARFAAALDVDGATTGGDAIKVNSSAIVFFGHSQGSTHGSLGVPYAPEYQAAVFSGNGASLKDSLMTKTSPVNIKAAVPVAVADFNTDFELPGGDKHPVLTLLQQFIDPADPLNFAELYQNPDEGVVPRSVFSTYGLGDTYSTPAAMATYIRAARMDLVSADSSASEPDAISGLDPVAPPLSANQTVGEVTITLGARQYGPPDDRDGHFVVFDVQAANDDVTRFLGMAALGVAPQIGN